MVALPTVSPDMQMATYLAYAGQAAEHMNSNHALVANEALINLTRAPIQAQEKSMESALEQAQFAGLSGNITLSDVNPRDVSIASTGSNVDKGHDGIS